MPDLAGKVWLVVALEERRIDLKRLADALAAPRFSFGNADLLFDVLGVRPGSVTPFALANDAGQHITVVLDRGMLEHDPLNYHPLENNRTTAIAPPTCCSSSRLAATGRASSISIPAQPTRPADRCGRVPPERLSSPRSAAMFCRISRGERPHDE